MLTCQRDAWMRRRQNLPMKATVLFVGTVLLGTVGVTRHFWVSAIDASPRRLADAANQCPGAGHVDLSGPPGAGVAEEMENEYHVKNQPKMENALASKLAALLRRTGLEVDPAVIWFFLNTFGLFYMFVALFIACDEFFVPSLEIISDKLRLSPDVAGATFMAAGGSAPEFFTSLVSAFAPEPSGVGISAIVGSAIFNVLFVIAACGVCAPGTLKLTGYPLARDSVFYLIDLVCLMVFFGFNSPGVVELWEAAVLFILYIVYCIFMAYSSTVEEKMAECGDERRFRNLDKNHDGGLDDSEVAWDPELKQALKDGADTNKDGKLSKQEVKVYLKSRRHMRQVAQAADENVDENESAALNLWPPQNAGCAGWLWYFLTWPLVLLLMVTVPDVRRGDWSKNLFLLTFLLSIGWIAVFSWIMVYCTEVVGLYTGISAEILALTLLAWGTSVPDLLTSILVTLQHRGDMAVSSSIGSNIFDVTVGLPVPFLLRIMISGCDYPVNADGVVSSIGLLVVMLMVTIGSIMCNGWVLNKCLGVMMFILWGVIQAWTMWEFMKGDKAA